MKYNLILLAGIFSIFIYAGTVFADAEVTLISEGTNFSDQTSFNVTCEDIGLTRTLSMGKKGDDVMILQEVLAYNGYYTGAIDGQFGSMTRSAVKMAQEAVSVQADGVVGPLTRYSMQEMCMGVVANS